VGSQPDEPAAVAFPGDPGGGRARADAGCGGAGGGGEGAGGGDGRAAFRGVCGGLRGVRRRSGGGRGAVAAVVAAFRPSRRGARRGGAGGLCGGSSGGRRGDPEPSPRRRGARVRSVLDFRPAARRSGSAPHPGRAVHAGAGRADSGRPARGSAGTAVAASAGARAPPPAHRRRPRSTAPDRRLRRSSGTGFPVEDEYPRRGFDGQTGSNGPGCRAFGRAAADGLGGAAGASAAGEGTPRRTTAPRGRLGSDGEEVESPTPPSRKGRGCPGRRGDASAHEGGEGKEESPAPASSRSGGIRCRVRGRRTPLRRARAGRPASGG